MEKIRTQDKHYIETVSMELNDYRELWAKVNELVDKVNELEGQIKTLSKQTNIKV